MGKLLKKMRPKDWLLGLTSIIFILIQVWMDLSLPEYMGRITLLVQIPDPELNAILRAGGFMLLFALGSLAASCITAVCVSGLAFSYGGNLRKALFHQVMSFSMEESGKFSTASLITRSTNDITQVQGLIAMGLQLLVKALITAVGAIGKISGTVWQWTAATAIGAVIIVAVVMGCILLVVPRQKKVQLLTDNINRVARENLVGISVIHAYNADMEGTYDAMVAQGGTNLSGGQKQRLSIARTLVRKPEILIFDDSFSALDYKTERKLRENIKENYEKTTKIIVSQRIGTIRDADLILVMDKGKIAGQGTHQELMESCDIYRQIAASQNEMEAIV